ncbi:MAG: 50S ribosomal protein L23 [Anaerolineae bacterium]|jgi:large subunit ribosomal protein L23|nr:MAG: 50S ribosomal protein L23 [Anaerolineae bacterium]MCL4879571.1 50S ribosomal protein L23 [Anaerolineae bacterium]
MAGELHLYDVIRRPIITEKANLASDTRNQYTFEVDINANKIQIKDAIEIIFDVDVMGVNTMVMAPKRGRRGRKFYIRKKKWKKAIVTIAKGQQIPLFDNV